MDPGDVLDSRFHIEHEAGAGAMGVIYRARDSFSGKTVAVKVLKGSRSVSARFLREARVLAKLQHPAVVEYVAHGTTLAGEQFLAMEWLEGEDLESRLLRGPLGIEESLVLARRVADALSVAHARGVVHRDLKPNNLYLVDGAATRVKLLDFGIARVENATAGMTAAGAVMGTPGYMAPEQVRGEAHIDARADVFSLGCVLFECLTGRPVFVGDNVLALLAKIVLEEPARCIEHRPDVPRAIDDLVSRMLSKTPAERPADGAAAREAIAELEDKLHRGALGALPPTQASAVPLSITRGEVQVVSVVIASTAPRTTPQRVTEALSSAGSSLPVSIDDYAPPKAVPKPDDSKTEIMSSGPEVDDSGSSDAYAPTFAVDPAVSEDLGRFGARVERLADGVVVATLHGGGVATDQAAQAARCALSLRRKYPRAPIVLATGRGVFLGRLPVGHVIEKAAKMLRALPPQLGEGAATIHVDEVTAGLLPSRFRVRASTPYAELTNEERGADLPRTLLGRTTPFVGRDADIATLLGVFAQVDSERIPRAVVVTGAPGLGKSRLREELAARLRSHDAAPAMWIGAAEAMGAGAPLRLLARALRSAIGITEDAPPHLPITRLFERVSKNVAPAEVGRVATFLAEILGLPHQTNDGFAQAEQQLQAARREPPLMAEQMVRAFVDFVAAESTERPIVIVLEDAHWGDLPTMKFVDAALRELDDRPIMAIAFGRPEVEDAFPALWAERGVLRLALAALTPRSAERLAREVLGKDADVEVVRRVVQQAGGNPFFLEELLRSVAAGERGALPETVLAIVQKRLEALDEGARRILRAASVFGGVFWRGSVAALLGGERPTELERALEELVHRELIVTQTSSRFAAEPELAFRHALVRDAAYHMLTDADRALGHRLAGAWLEKVGEQNAALLADHFERGGDLDSALRCYVVAATHAIHADDLAGCLRLAKHGLEAARPGDARRGALHLACAEAHHWRAEFEEARSHGTEALRLIERGSPPWFEAISTTIAACATVGRTADATTLATELAHAGSADNAAFLMAAARVVAFLPPGDTGDALLALLPEPREDESDALFAARVEVSRGVRAVARGDRVRVLEHFSSASRHFDRAGHARGARAARANAGFASTELGRHEDAERLLRNALDDARRLGVKTTIGWALMHLGMVVGRLGRMEEALSLEREAFEVARQQGNRKLEAEVAIATADVLNAMGQPDQAVVEAERARTAEAPALRAAALATLTTSHVALGDAAKAMSAASEAKELLDAKTGAEEVELAVRLAEAEALHASGRRVDALVAIDAAATTLMARASDISDAARRSIFLERVPVNARILLCSRTWPRDDV